MDWHKLISQIEYLTQDDLEMQNLQKNPIQAMDRLNKAVRQLQGGNGDIALIALRSLTGQHPRFGLAHLTLGLALAQAGEAREAEIHIRHALQSCRRPLDLALAEQALAGLAGGKTTPTATTGQTARRQTKSRPPIHSNNLLEKSSRKNPVRMASSRERQEVLAKGDLANPDETRVQLRRAPAEILRIALPVAAVVLIVAAIVFFGIRLAGDARTARQLSQQNQERLDWLLTRLETLDDESVQSLLGDYELAFSEPSAAPTETEPVETQPELTSETAAETLFETTVETTAEPAETSAAQTSAAVAPEQQIMLSAEAAFAQALDAIASDLILAGNRLLEVRLLLADIPAQTLGESYTDAAALSAAVEAEIASIGEDAAELNRRQGMVLYNREQYEQALDFFLAGYQLFPRSFGGGTAYYCGKCYQMLGDYEKARPYYDYVIATFDGRDIATSAKARLREMGY